FVQENVARVRRDEAKAAEEERARTERAALADNEDRVRRLKRRAATGASGAAAAAVSSAADIFGGGASGAPAASSAIDDESAMTKHVNLFAELEEQERTNTTVGNREYAAERKKEQDDWESKVGIMKRFAEDTKEYAKETEWWQGIPLVREGRVDKQQPDKSETKKSTKFMTGEEKRALKRAKKRKGRKKGKRRHSPSSGSSSSSSDDSEEERRKKTKLDELRKQRLVRERQEQAKAKRLFEPDKEEKPTVVKNQIDEDRQRRYNSQFNPDLARP
uniref:Cir_N domain-containing protein n=2 Tax=Globodera pallida TaxID=36090 RepID=A0A183CSF3_GLOPA